MFAQHIEDLVQRGRFVRFFHRRQFAGEAAGGRFEDLAFRIGLFGLVLRGRNRSRVTSAIDTRSPELIFRFVFPARGATTWCA